MIKHSDEQRSLMGFVWPMMFSLQKQAEKLISDDYVGSMPLSERKSVKKLIADRWAYLHAQVHSAAYVLNPRFVGMDHFDDDEVKNDFEEVLNAMLPNEEAVGQALTEYNEYHEKKGKWAKKLIWIRAKQLPPHEFWLEQGRHSKWLGKIAPKLLTLAHAAGGAERNWSTHGFINSRNRT
eukprot:7389374-Prymnesium_polylepis.1